MQIKLYELRKKAGIKQEDLAKMLGISQNSYGHKERGDTDFKLSEMFKIANFFNRKIGDIFSDSTSRKVK